MAKTGNPISKCIILIIRAYQYCISPMLGSSCRFHPTCSAYTLQAMKVHGLMRGSFYSVKRILSCHPWHQGGVDPIPDKNSI